MFSFYLKYGDYKMKKDDEPPSGFCGFFLSFDFFLRHIGISERKIGDLPWQ